jgi:hypothetical protein
VGAPGSVGGNITSLSFTHSVNETLRGWIAKEVQRRTRIDAVSSQDSRGFEHNMRPSGYSPAEIRHVKNFALNMRLSSDKAWQMTRAYDAPPPGLISGGVNATSKDAERHKCNNVGEVPEHRPFIGLVDIKPPSDLRDRTPFLHHELDRSTSPRALPAIRRHDLLSFLPDNDRLRKVSNHKVYSVAVVLINIYGPKMSVPKNMNNGNDNATRLFKITHTYRCEITPNTTPVTPRTSGTIIKRIGAPQPVGVDP